MRFPIKDGEVLEHSIIVERAVNVMALPGMFSSSSTISDEVQEVTEAAKSTFVATTGKQAELQDTQWKTSHKNYIGNIKKQEDLGKEISSCLHGQVSVDLHCHN
jgi:hypothetical protein